jgi:hypothetical protein
MCGMTGKQPFFAPRGAIGYATGPRREVAQNISESVCHPSRREQSIGAVYKSLMQGPLREENLSPSSQLGLLVGREHDFGR